MLVQTTPAPPNLGGEFFVTLKRVGEKMLVQTTPAPPNLGGEFFVTLNKEGSLFILFPSRRKEGVTALEEAEW